MEKGIFTQPPYLAVDNFFSRDNMLYYLGKSIYLTILFTKYLFPNKGRKNIAISAPRDEISYLKEF